MFSCIVVGEIFSRKASIYNSLAASAFMLFVIIHIFCGMWVSSFLTWLLSGIVIFQKPVYNYFILKINCWIISGSLPLFHWPHKYLLSLFVFIIFTSFQLFFYLPIFYCSFFNTYFICRNIFNSLFMDSIAWSFMLGKLTWWLIWLMNKIILFFNDLPYAVVGWNTCFGYINYYCCIWL